MTASEYTPPRQTSEGPTQGGQITQQIQNASGGKHSVYMQQINDCYNTNLKYVGHLGKSIQNPNVVLKPGPSMTQQIQDASGLKCSKVVQKIVNAGNSMLLRVGEVKKKSPNHNKKG